MFPRKMLTEFYRLKCVEFIHVIGILSNDAKCPQKNISSFFLSRLHDMFHQYQIQRPQQSATHIWQNVRLRHNGLFYVATLDIFGCCCL